MRVELTARQREILRRLVEEYVSSGQPVGSKYLVEHSGLTVSASTVRNELAVLEELGLLTHPHTSAGRVPTESGYRLYADELLGRLDVRPNEFPLDLGPARTELETALQETTEMLSQVTRLLALVSAPPFDATTVRHVEVLLLQPHVAMAVVITSAGGVSKRVVEFPEPVDPGVAAWAREYLNETLAGIGLGSRELRRRLEDAGLSSRERSFLEALRPVFTELLRDDQRVYVGGAATLLDEVRVEELDAYRRLLEVLEQRAGLIDIVGEALEPRRAFVRVGEELDNPALRDAALVGASYGLAHRTLGAVSLLGPVRMDYDKALRAVRAAAVELSRFVESAYEER